jgi:PadR family transcriptional regulator PadR
MELWNSPVGKQNDPAGGRGRVKPKKDVPQGTLALMVLKTLDVLGPLHGYGIARRIEQISGDVLSVNQGTLYPVLLRLEQERAIASDWGPSENNRRARFYRLTRGGQKLLEAEKRGWEQTAAIIARFFEVKADAAKTGCRKRSSRTSRRRPRTESAPG